MMELPKNQLSAMLGFSVEQKAQFARTGSMGIPITSQKSGLVSPAYYGSPPGVGMVPFNNSPLTSPVLPGSPVGPGSFRVRRDERSMRLCSASRTSSGNIGSSGGGIYAGWQGQKATDTTEEVRGSTLLEEFKNSKIRRFELSDIAGHVVEFRYGLLTCSFLL
jgi:pumilio RNA-binding family